jgi:2-iminobutanoate/2-iminopropanoate deaminase
MKKSVIATDKAPRAIGAYSQAVRTEGGALLFISGQLGLNPETMDMVSGGVGPETTQAMKNLGAILKAAGGGFESIIKATIYLAEIDDFAAINEVYASFFPVEPPARAAFAVAALPKGARVEIEAVAAI